MRKAWSGAALHPRGQLGNMYRRAAHALSRRNSAQYQSMTAPGPWRLTSTQLTRVSDSLRARTGGLTIC